MTEDQILLLECLADDEQWQEWEQESAKYEVTMDYYLEEFV